MARKHIRAGDLRHLITLQRLVEDQDSSGDIIRGYLPVDTVYSAVQPFSSRELIAAQAVQNNAVVRFVIRHRDDIDTAWRVGYRGRVYAIEGALADADSGIEYLTLTCSLLSVDAV